jgi:hypothetical protein
MATLSRTLAVPVDPVALGVVVSALAHRAVLGYSVVGAGPRDWLDMRPFERSQRDGVDETTGDADAVTDGGAATGSDSRRPAVDPWLPYQYRWGNVAALGAVVGVLSAYVAYITASPFLAFGITVVALAFLCAGVAEIPVTHHMALPASTVVLALVETSGPLTPTAVAGSLPLGTALVAGAAFGVLGGLLGELLQRVFYAHAETHLDPPAASIVCTSLLLAVLSIVGVLPSAVWVPTP